ncbi:MAG: UDP-N-acetylmuramate dehydrogenase, partial [candidate division Zixibacteria bacterium]|nr:UDP-N-acetylmuramate dehydrogenase [candidate division Zixibacteria bacterium]NIW43959.1 UDP-N-acetylmuramate dehydrogenase [Gammaproteobacteria bacterium]
MKVQQKAINNAIGILKQEFPDNCYLNEVLAPYTSYKVGGPADALIIPKNVADLEYIIRYCIQNQLPYFILGKGANILVHDDGFRGLAVLLERCCHQLFHQNNLLYVGAGVTVQALVEYCEEHNLGGLEYMSGIPGTVGGALTMNAGAFVGEIGDRVLRIDALNAKGKRVELHKDEALFGYRQAEGLKNQVLLGCWLSVDKGDRAALAAAREGYLQRRAAKQPLDHPSCGSVFKRPPGDYAGRLVEAAGCKGFTIGGAMVSPKHANFIVNYNQAIASDIYEVIRQVQQKVYDLF